MQLRPTPPQERWILIAARLAARRDGRWMADRCGGWRAVATTARCAFFVLGAFAAGLTAAIFNLIRIPGYLVITGLLLVAFAEWLIVKRRLFGAGIEEALEVAGLIMIVFQAVEPNGETSEVRASLLVAIALAVAGFRLLNPFFITLSAVALSFATDLFGAQHLSSHSLAESVAGGFCFAVAAIALVIGRAEFDRPSYDQMLNWLIVAMPLMGYIWTETKNTSGIAIDLVREVPFDRSIAFTKLIAFGIAALIVGIRRRSHAPIIAFMVCAGCVAFELRNLTTLSLQVKLIGWGSVVLLLMLGLDRYLRTPHRGITSSKHEEGDGSLDLLQLAGASALAPVSVEHTEAQFQGGGGAGGGGGATGRY